MTKVHLNNMPLIDERRIYILYIVRITWSISQCNIISLVDDLNKRKQWKADLK